MTTHEGHLFSRDAALALAVSVLVPVALFTLNLGTLNRVLYPLMSFALGAYLYQRRSPWFLGFLVWLFCASPLVRRLTDLQAGWDVANPVLIAPYLVGMLAALSFFPYVTRTSAHFATPFLFILGCVGYGVLLALIDGRVVSGIVDGLRWSVGPLCTIYLLRNKDLLPGCHRAVTGSLLIAGPAIAVYGVFQFVNPLEWDREWMRNIADVGFDSIGNPAPFEVRVFGTLNSPASYAMFLIVCSFVQIGRPLVQLLPAMLVIAMALALTQYRAGWGGFVIGMLCFVFYGGAREKMRVVGAAVALVFASGFLALVPEVSAVVTERFSTLGRLSDDASGQARIDDYRAFFENTADIVQGQGLAISGPVRRLDGKATQILDGGLMEPYGAFGIFGGTAFFGGIFALFWLIWRVPTRPLPDLPLYRAIVTATFAQIVFGRVLMGEAGFCAWLALGLALSKLATRTETDPFCAQRPLLGRDL